MFERTQAADAADTRWDVIIGGSSFASMFFLRGLRADLRVLIIEKGEIIDWEAQVFQDRRPVEAFDLRNSTDRPKQFVAHTLFGGNSNCWWGQTPRFHPSDFQLNGLYGVGRDWPIGYDDLAPYYDEVEAVMQIAGGRADHILPRAGDFPFPAHDPSRTDAIALAERPDIWVPVPTARSNGGDRATCCANGICHSCPIDSKFTILNGLAAFERPGVRVLTSAEIREVRTEAGRATGVSVASRGERFEIAGDAVALGTNAIFNAAILLRSGLTSPALGRYLHEQASETVILDVAQSNYFGGSSITGHCYGHYDGPHRSQSAAVLIENFNAPADVRTTKGRWTDRMVLKLIAEDIPQDRNRVVLEADEPVIEWHGHSEYAYAGIERAASTLSDLLPFAIEEKVESREGVTEAHIQGTHRIGRNAGEGVIGGTLETHDVSGLYALGAGAFPSCSPANPTLTLSALSLRAGRSIR